jgi:hypothetical protein
MRVIDIAPNEASLAMLADRLASSEVPLTEDELKAILDVEPAFREAATRMLREFLDRKSK